MMEEKIAARIAALTTERDQFVVGANATVQAYNAAIAELQNLIAEPAAVEYVEQIAADA